MITITAFAWVPAFAQGYVKDLRVRWALEEAELPYRVRLLKDGEGDTAKYRGLQPFGQVPVLMDDGLTLFESGAIVRHLGERSAALLPLEAQARARATQWMFAALNSIEPFTAQLAQLDVFYPGEEWARLRRPSLEAFVRRRLQGLSDALGEKPFLDGDPFTAGDLLMATVLRDVADQPAFREHANLVGYLERCTARPAFGRALDAQLGDFRQAA
jgi:glutathione S-transferase